MVVLDVSVVNVALPSIQADLGFAPTTLQWVVNAYALTFAGFMLLGGRLADVYGIRPTFLTGLALFSVSSLVGGLADTALTLTVARAFQGLGAAILAPATLTLLTTTFAEGPKRSKALAIWTACALAGGTAGNVIGGLLTELLSWHWVLLINVPIGIVAFPLSWIFLHQDQNEGVSPRLDVPGAILATLGLGTLIYAITLTEQFGWKDASTQIFFSLAIIALSAFLWVEAKLAPHPLIPLRLFQKRSIASGNLVMLFAGAAFMPMWYFLSLYMQDVLHYSPLETGFGFLPHTLITMIVGIRLTPWLMGHVDDRVLVVVGAMIAAAGFYHQAHVDPQSGYVQAILIPGMIFSFGGGLLNTPLTNVVTSGIAKGDAGAASGIMNTAKQVGGGLGLACLVTLVADSHSAADPVQVYGGAFHAIGIILLIVALLSIAIPRKARPIEG